LRAFSIGRRCMRSLRCGTISRVTSRLTAAPDLRDLERLRRVRDRDREQAQLLDVETLAAMTCADGTEKEPA
jgi:hypothetical protein